MLTKSTAFFRPDETERKWYVIDATDQIVGKLAVRITDIIRGKTKPCYTPNANCGDHVIVINAEKVVFSGNKLEQKEYFHHTGYFGGIRSVTAQELLEKKPEEVLENAVKGMLPKNRLSKQIVKQLKVYSGSEHPHATQNPTPLSV